MSIKLHHLLHHHHPLLSRFVPFALPEPNALARTAKCSSSRLLLRCKHIFAPNQCHHFSTTTGNARLLSVLFYGSDDFSLESLRLLKGKLVERENGHKTKVALKRLEVVTTSSSNHIYNYCQKVQLPCHFFDSYTVPDDQFDLGVVSSFGRLIPRQAIEACHYGMLNIHGSLLPRWRGASPIQHAILANDKVTGLTIMRIKPKRFDVGQIIAQREIEILHRVTGRDLKQMMAPLGAHLLWEVLQNLDSFLANARDQPEEGVTQAPKLRAVDGEIIWSQMDATQIDRRCRALCGCIDTFTHWIDGTPLRLSEVVDPDLVARLNMSQLSGCGEQHIPGLVCYHKKRHLLAIASANGTWSAFRSFTLKGRKKMSALGFYNTFIRPITKMYKQKNAGQKPLFILGQSTERLLPESPHFVGVHNYDQLEQISAKLKL